MQFIVEWRLPSETHRQAAEAFIKTGAPEAPGMTILGRWHAPGSYRGWVLVESSDPAAMAEHATEWARYIEIDFTPVVSDDVASDVMKKVYG